MNEKIKLFAKQAEQYADDIFNSDPAKYDTPEQEKVWCEMMQEKFAELIVKECCSKLKEMGEGWHEFAMNPPDGQAHNASGALFAAYRLKEDAVDEIRDHFGVEE